MDADQIPAAMVEAAAIALAEENADGRLFTDPHFAAVTQPAYPWWEKYRARYRRQASAALAAALSACEVRERGGIRYLSRDQHADPERSAVGWYDPITADEEADACGRAGVPYRRIRKYEITTPIEDLP